MILINFRKPNGFVDGKRQIQGLPHGEMDGEKCGVVGNTPDSFL